MSGSHTHTQLSKTASTFLSVAGNAPSYSFAMTSATLIAAVGHYSPWVILFCGLVMYGIANAYVQLTRFRNSSGAAFTWVSHFLHPRLGFIAGWCLLVAGLLFLVSVVLPAAQVIAQLVGLNEVSKLSITLIAIGVLLVFAFLALSGVGKMGVVQTIFTTLEAIVLVILLIAIVAAIAQTDKAAVQKIFASEPPTLEAISKGISIAVFFYWGWDVAFNAAENTDNPEQSLKQSAYRTLFALILFFTCFVFGFTLLAAEADIANANGNALLALSRKILPSPYAEIALLAFLLSTIGAVNSAYVQISQTLFAKSKSGYYKGFFARGNNSIHAPRSGILFALFTASVILLIAAVSAKIDEIIQAAIVSTSILIALYYSLCALSYCRYALSKGKISSWGGFALSALAALMLFFAALVTLVSFNFLTTFISVFALGLGVLLSFGFKLKS
ncbi:MAG: hypothetical protein RLZZ502_1230 [Pseudomonadota bacterium]